MYERVSKTNYYLDIAQTVSERSTCIRRRYGAVIVKNDSIVSTGYNGSARGRKNCCDCGFCKREQEQIPHGEQYEKCRSVHAEANAIVSASREQLIGSTLYLSCTDWDDNLISNTDCCMMCKRTILNAGISKVIIRNTKTEYKEINTENWKDLDE